MNKNENIDSKLDKLKKDKPFLVPDGYFDNLAYKIQVKTQSSESFQVSNKYTFNLKAILTYSLVFIFFAVTTITISQLVLIKNTDKTLTQTEINELFEQGAINFNSYELAELYINEIDYYNFTENIDRDNLESFLTDENINELTLINELE